MSFFKIVTKEEKLQAIKVLLAADIRQDTHGVSLFIAVRKILNAEIMQDLEKDSVTPFAEKCLEVICTHAKDDNERYEIFDLVVDQSYISKRSQYCWTLLNCRLNERQELRLIKTLENNDFFLEKNRLPNNFPEDISEKRKLHLCECFLNGCRKSDSKRPLILDNLFSAVNLLAGHRFELLVQKTPSAFTTWEEVCVVLQNICYGRNIDRILSSSSFHAAVRSMIIKVNDSGIAKQDDHEFSHPITAQ